MDARQQVIAAAGQVEALAGDAFSGVVMAMLGSIVDGSAVTGSPGQPVSEGTLYRSWGAEFDGPMQATISTPLEYAQPAEDGLGSLGQAVAYGAENPTSPAKTGGSHSVALTIAGAQRLVDLEVQRVAALKGTVIDSSTGYRGEEGG